MRQDLGFYLGTCSETDQQEVASKSSTLPRMAPISLSLGPLEYDSDRQAMTSVTLKEDPLCKARCSHKGMHGKEMPYFLS